MPAFVRRNDPARQKLSAIMLLAATLALMLACAIAAGSARHSGGGYGPHNLLAKQEAAPSDDGAIKAEMTAKALGLPNRA
jgi:hypothetical protein